MYIIRKKRPNPGEHPYIPELKYLYQQKRISRREFLQNATMLGLSLVSASAFLASCSSEEAATATSPPEPTQPPAAATAVPTATMVPEPTPGGPKRGGELVIGWDIQDLSDPHSSQWLQFNIQMNVAEYLVDLNPDNLLVPLLLEKWEASDDVKTWTFYVRKGINFNHGPELTADDVIWNIERWLDPETGSPLTGTLTNYFSATDIEKVDDYTLKVHTKQPYVGLINQISGGSFAAHILPKDWPGDWVANPWGTGPFTLEEFVLDERAVLKRRDGYWRDGLDGKPLPYLDGVRYVYLGGEDAAEVAALETGEVDLIEATAAQVEIVKGTDIVVAQQISGATMLSQMRSDEAGAFHDNRLRMALKLCQDREQILQTVYNGYGITAGDHHVSPIYEEYCPMEIPKPDIERAKALLAEAGHPDGFTIAMTVNDTEPYRTYAQLLKDQCAPAGINLELEIVPSSLYWENWMEMDLGLVPWAHRPSALMILETAHHSQAEWNGSHWGDEEFDQLLAEAGSTVDVEERREIMCKLQKIQEERGGEGIPIFTTSLNLHRPRLQNFRCAPGTHTYITETWLDDEA